MFSTEVLMFPLNIYDDSAFNEKMTLPVSDNYPLEALGLIQQPLNPESRPDSPETREKLLGTWQIVEVVKMEDNGNMFTVLIGGVEVLTLPRSFICFQSDHKS